MMMQVTKSLEKQEMEWDEQPLIPEHLGSSPKLKSLHDLSVRIEGKVAEEAIDYVGLWVDGGAQLHVPLQCELDPSDPLQKFHPKTLLLLILWPLACAGLRLDCAAPCCEGMKDDDRDKSSDMFRGCDEVSQLDELDESTHFNFLKCLLHLASILTKNDARKRGPSTLGVSIKH
jgi:hypothetical protein